MADEGLVDRLEELLTTYLQSAGERELFQASELGRALVDAGTRPEQLLAAHVTAMGRILSRLPPAAVADGALRSYQMLLEALMAYFLAYQPPVPATDADQATTPPAGGDYRAGVGLEDLYQQAQDRAAHFRDLVEVGNELVAAAGLTDALQRALQRSMELTGAVTGAVWLIDVGGRLAWRAGEMGGAAPILERLAHQALDGREAVVEGRQEAGEATDGGHQLAVGLPLTPPDGTPVGALTVMVVDGSAEHSSQGLDLLRLLASQLGAVIATAQLQEQLQRNVDALVTLNGIGQALVHTLDPHEVAQLVLDGALQFAGVEAAAIIPLDGWLTQTQQAVDDQELLARRDGDAPVDDARKDVVASGRARHMQADADPDAGELWILPLQVGDRTVGTLDMHVSPADAFRQLPALLESLAHHGASAIENARLYQSALAHEQALQDLVSKLITAQEEERRRVAYDIHDGLAQTTVATFQQLQLLAGRYRPRSPGARSYLEGALRAGQRAVNEAREVIAGLRPTILDDFGLAAALKREVEALHSEGREVTFEDRIGPARFTPQIETTLYRVAQESLTNIRKHAGPSPVRVTIEQVGDTVRLEVRDWGRGLRIAGPDARGHQRVGLAGMRERLALVGGDFSIVGPPGSGTTVTAVVPAARR